MRDRDHRVAVLTGAAGGLGRALAGELYREGFALALVDIDAVGLEAVQAELAGGSLDADDLLRRDLSGISLHCVDIADESAVARLAAEVLAAHGRVDWLINNAAVSISQSFAQLQLTDLRRLFEVNYWGTVHCTKYFLPYLLAGEESRLVNMASGFALMGFPGKTSYGSSKAAIMSLTYALRTELAGTAVRVCLVIPPPMPTGIVRKGLHIDETKRTAEMRFLLKNGMAPERAAARMMRKLLRGRFRIIVDAHTYFIDAMTRLFPSWVHRMIGRRKEDIDFY